MRAINQVIWFMIGLGVAGAIGVTVIQLGCPSCRDGIVRVIPSLDGRGDPQYRHYE